MLNKRVLRICVGGAAMLGAIATAKATVCYFPRLTTEMQIQSVTIDGVEQTDLTKYQKLQLRISPSEHDDHPNGFDIYQAYSKSTDFYFPEETYDPQ